MMTQQKGLAFCIKLLVKRLSTITYRTLSVTYVITFYVSFVERFFSALGDDVMNSMNQHSKLQVIRAPNNDVISLKEMM